MKNYNKSPLNEITRNQIIRRSKQESPDRFAKIKNYFRQKDFDNVDFVKLFEDDEFVWSTTVGDYVVTISFEGAFQNLYNYVRGWSGKNRWKRINIQLLSRCLTKSLDTEDLYVNCTCPDFKYRFAYWLTKADAKYGEPENRPPTVRNVKNNKGYVCKHVLSVLYGKRWVPAAAKVWLEYIRANPEVTEEYIWG